MYRAFWALAIISIFILLFPLTGFASNKMFLVEITAKTLNIRARPSTEAKVIGALKRGQRIIASPATKDWAMTLTDGSSFGYVSTDYMKIVRVLSPSSSTEEEEGCNAHTADLDLSVLNVDFRCDEDLMGESYESCSALVDVEINTDCEEPMKAWVDCEAQIEYKTKDGLMSRNTFATGTESVHVEHGSGNMIVKVYWSPPALDEVIQVEMLDCSCSMTDVYDY